MIGYNYKHNKAQYYQDILPYRHLHNLVFFDELVFVFPQKFVWPGEVLTLHRLVRYKPHGI